MLKSRSKTNKVGPEKTMSVFLIGCVTAALPSQGESDYATNLAVIKMSSILL
jgi:hypothetical protein